MRKLLIGFISLGVVLVIFLIYNFIGRTPSTDNGNGARYIDTAIDSNIVGTDSDIGKIGEVGVGTIRKAVYTTLNKNKEVEREWGFERLLHQAKELWEIEKPFMNVYERDFKCYITADKGEVKIETIAEKPTPKDATFTGNVVVHIVPNDASDIKESYIYLDDIAFISERSQLATAGPVRFVSEDAQMLGTGLELVYNEQLERIELFRIVRLESLRIKSSQMAFLSSIAEPAESKDKSPNTAKTINHAESQGAVAAASTNNTKPQQDEMSPQEVSPQTSLAQAEQNEGDYYKCIFNKNVVIDTPEQVIFAADSLSIGNLFWSNTTTKKSDTTTAEITNDANAPIVETNEPDIQIAADADADFPAANFVDINSIINKPVDTAKVAASPQNEPNKTSQEFVNIVVTCDASVVLVPQDYPWSNNQSAQSEAKTSDSIIENIKNQNVGRERILFIAKTIDYSATTGDVVTAGLTELTLYTNNTTDTDVDRTPVPVTVTAQDGARFLQGQDKVIFEGDCVCTMPQTGLSEQRNATLSAKMITVNVPKDEKRNVLVYSDVIAAGPVNLEFFAQDSRIQIDPNDPNITETIPTIVPVKVRAREQARFIPSSNVVVFEGDCVCSMPQKGLTPPKDCTFTSPQITISLSKEDSELSSAVPDISAVGPAEFAFYLKDFAAADANEPPLPAKVTARNNVSFSAILNRIVFEGDCQGTTVQKKTNSIQEYTFRAPRLTLDLHKESNNQSSELTAGIKHLKADGGVVRLATIKKAKAGSSPAATNQSNKADEILGGIELKCSQFDYDPNSQLLMATGPGMIMIDNSKITEPKGDVGRFSLRSPSYGFLKNFDTLKYYMGAKKIVADSRSPGLFINYIPVVNGKYDDDIFATTSHVEAYLSESAEGKAELSTLVASGGVEFIDVNKKNTFIGSKLFYDHKKSTIIVTGDQTQPCNCNGALVDEIIYDLTTGVIEAQVVAPGAL